MILAVCCECSRLNFMCPDKSTVYLAAKISMECQNVTICSLLNRWRTLFLSNTAIIFKATVREKIPHSQNNWNNYHVNNDADIDTIFNPIKQIGTCSDERPLFFRNTIEFWTMISIFSPFKLEYWHSDSVKSQLNESIQVPSQIINRSPP